MSGMLRRTVFVIVCAAFGSFLAPEADAVEVQRVRADGIEAWLVEDHSVPVLTVHVAFRGGAAADPAGKEGLAGMAAALLDEGAEELDSHAFRSRLEAMAIEMGFSAELDRFGGQLRTLTEHRNEALRLFGLALLRPRFDAEPLRRVRSQLQARLLERMEDPDSVANLRLFLELFPNHPYGRPAEGYPESIEAITQEDLQAFVARRFSRDALVVGVVGDITAAGLAPLLASSFGELTQRAAPVAIDEAIPTAGGRPIIVDMPVPQSIVLFAQPGLKRTDPDFYALTIIDRVLGGSFTSRLYREVREKRGLAYSVSTSLVAFDHAALIVGSVATANERVSETLRVVREQWRQIAETGITPAELADAKAYLTGSFPLRFTRSSSIAHMLVGMQLQSLGIDYFDRRNALIEAVTLEDVNRVAQSLLRPEALVFVVAGQPEGLAPTD
jgi:zinc protease